MGKLGDPEHITEASERIAGQGAAGANWVSLIDPEPRLHKQHPWVLKSGLGQIALLDYRVEPKEHVETLASNIRSAGPSERIEDFIDIGPEEYITDSRTHLPRLWDHFQESCGYNPAKRGKKRG